jgi:hypothetical protein
MFSSHSDFFRPFSIPPLAFQPLIHSLPSSLKDISVAGKYFRIKTKIIISSYANRDGPFRVEGAK